MPFLSTGASIGLDIGTSAVRAAHVSSARGGYSLQTFGQVALPAGAVVDGEIIDAGAVSEAVAQLWKRAKLRSKRAVVGVANQRVVVRQVDLPYLEEKEFRSSLAFQVADHIPMPVEAAQLDFEILDEYLTDNNDRMMRVLLMAASTDMVQSFIDAISAAGLEPAGVDLTPFAVARAVSPAARGEAGLPGAEAIIDIGAGVTNVVVHRNAEPRFVRILLVGGNAATDALASASGVTFDEAEAIKLDLGRGVGSPETLRVLNERVQDLVDEIRGSIDYYLSQEDSDQIVSYVVTGGGALTPGLVQQLESSLGMPLRRAMPLAELDVGKSGLTADQVAQVQPIAAAAVGLGMGAGRG